MVTPVGYGPTRQRGWAFADVPGCRKKITTQRGRAWATGRWMLRGQLSTCDANILKMFGEVPDNLDEP
jgi:hypothetical protein